MVLQPDYLGGYFGQNNNLKMRVIPNGLGQANVYVDSKPYQGNYKPLNLNKGSMTPKVRKRMLKRYNGWDAQILY